jgi:hypothetical protein
MKARSYDLYNLVKQGTSNTVGNVCAIFTSRSCCNQVNSIFDNHTEVQGALPAKLTCHGTHLVRDITVIKLNIDKESVQDLFPDLVLSILP